ncbi:uncharacterized protein LOC144127716 [Amblyomma americanum]
MVDSQKKDIDDLKERVEKIETQTATEEIKELKQQLNDLDQYNRRQNLEIHGLKQTDDENLLSKLNDIARELNIEEVTHRDIEAVHRLPSKPPKTPIVLVRFASRAVKEQWSERKALLRTKLPDLSFFDNMTSQNRKLLWLAKMRAKERSYQFAWQKNGRILVRKKQGEAAIHIKSEDDIMQIA